MKFKNFDIADVIGCNDIEQARAYTGKKGYYADHIEQLDDFIENNKHIGTLHSIASKDTFERLIVGCEFDYPCPYTYFLPLEKVQKTEQTGKQKYSKNRNTFDLWIANKVKVRVVTNVDDFDKTLFSILGVIEKYEKQGILLKDQNNKEHFICYPNILEVQYLGIDDWKEYLGLSTDEIDNV